MSRLVLLLALVALIAPSLADARLPAWVRLVDRDGQVLDIEILILDAITLCPTSGDANPRSVEDGEGIALIDTVFGELRWTYERKFYNEGAVTADPDLSGDQVVLIESVERVFTGNMEACTQHTWVSP